MTSNRTFVELGSIQKYKVQNNTADVILYQTSIIRINVDKLANLIFYEIDVFC